jgi:hypothetical protein
VTLNQPYFVGSMTSGVDGGSEGGRLSTTRLPSTLVLYALPLLQAVKRSGYAGKVTAEPALVEGSWVIRLVYEGEEPPSGVPELWQGHRVVVAAAPPPPEPAAGEKR